MYYPHTHNLKMACPFSEGIKNDEDGIETINSFHHKTGVFPEKPKLFVHIVFVTPMRKTFKICKHQ